jgi:hypothetical protein
MTKRGLLRCGQYLLLIGVCVPLGFRIWEEAGRLRGDSRLPDGSPVLPSAASWKDALKEGDQEARQALDLPPSLLAAVLQASTECPPPREGASQAEADLTRKLQEHARALRQARAFVEAYAPAAARDAGDLPGLFGRALKARELERKMLDARDREDADLKRLLDEYEQDKEVRNDSLHRRFSACAAWKELAKAHPRDALARLALDWLAEVEKARAAGQPMKDFPSLDPAARRRVELALAAQDKFPTHHPDVEPRYAEGAKKLRERWSNLRELADSFTVDRDRRDHPWRLEAFSGLLDTLGAAADRRALDTVRAAVVLMCKEYFPREKSLADLDADVLLFVGEASQKPVPRKEVTIKWKDSPESDLHPAYDESKAEKLRKQGLILHYFHRDTPYSRIGPTQKARPAWEYNEGRDALLSSLDQRIAFARLKEDFKKIRQALTQFNPVPPEELRKVDALMKALEALAVLWP